MRKIWRPTVFGFLVVFLGLLGGCFLLTAPPAPQNLSASDGEYADEIIVTWSAVRGATRYEVFRATSEDGEYEKIGETKLTRFSDTTASPNVLYWYRVRACNQFGCSSFSQTDSGYYLGQAPPQPPQNVQASDGTFSDRIRVTWSESIGASYYEVYRSDVPGADFLRVAQTGGTSYDDQEIVIGRTYYYKVKACNSIGCSDYSPTDSGFAAVSQPAAPQNVQASDGTFSDRVRITWSPVSGAARYEVHRASSQDGPYELRGETTETSYDDTQVTPGTTYWYKVRAWNVLGYGPFSAPDSGYAATGGGGGGGGGDQAPGQVQGVSASDGTYYDKIRITWNSVSGATTYRVYYQTQSGTFIQLAEVPSGTTSYDDARTAITMCQEVWYAVSAWNDAGEGPLSVPDSGYKGGTLQAVDASKVETTITPSSTNANEATVKLEWEAVKDADKLGAVYEIWRLDIGTYQKVGQTESTTFLDTVALGRTYRYKIRTCSDFPCITCAPFSGEIQISVACNPTPPSNISANKSGNQVTVSWSAVTGAQKYQVFRSTQADGTYTYVGDAEATANPSYTDSPPIPSSGTVTYYYKVKTCVACGCGPLSSPSDGVQFEAP